MWQDMRERRSAQRQISSEEVLHQESLTGDNRREMAVNSINNQDTIKGTGHFFETLSVASVPGTDHS